MEQHKKLEDDKKFIILRLKSYKQFFVTLEKIIYRNKIVRLNVEPKFFGKC